MRILKIILIVACLIALLAFILSLVVTHLCLSSGNPAPKCVRLLPELVLRSFGSDCNTITPQQYAAVIGDLIFLVTFFVTIVPLGLVWWNMRLLKKQFRDRYGIESCPISKPGVDDLAWMLEHYKKASRVRIFAGSFDWLATNGDLETRIKDLAREDKLELVSYRSRDEVKNALRGAGSLFHTLEQRFRFESGLSGVTCTMLEISPTVRGFLYRSRPERNQDHFNACVVQDTPQSQELLHIIDQLTKSEHWGNLNTTTG